MDNPTHVFTYTVGMENFEYRQECDVRRRWRGQPGIRILKSYEILLFE